VIMQALATLLAVFNPVCELAEYEVSYTNSSLPQDVAFQTALHQLIPPARAEQDFMQWYERGMLECNTYLATNPFEDKQRMSPLFNDAEKEVAKGDSCRGNKLLHDATGLLVWPFGPMGECETYSRCWFGLLTCGTFQHDKFRSTFDLPGREGDSFRGWSMRSLHVDMSVSGREVVAPRVRHSTFPTPRRFQNSSVGSVTSVLLVDYMLTVNGEYSIELGLLGLYPRVLYSVAGAGAGASLPRPNHEGVESNSIDNRYLLDKSLGKGDRSGRPMAKKISKVKHPLKSQPHRDNEIGGGGGDTSRPSKKGNKHLQEKMQEKQKSKLKFKPTKQITNPKSVELLKSVFLGGCERRPGGRTFCVQACQQQAQVVGSPFSMRARLAETGTGTHHREECGRGAAVTASSRPLPFCTGGNHPGRYLQLPPSLIRHCNSHKYSELLVEERARQFGKRQWFDRYDAVEYAYFRHAQTVELGPIFAEMKQNMQVNTSLSGSDSIINRQDVYYTELLRYLDNENICLLVDIGLSRKIPDSRADIYAPYSCKYRIYDWKKAAECHAEDRGHAMFHGDSMNRALFGRVW
jgi:hypothetical protein